MAGLEGELGTLLRVDMAGLALLGVIFLMALFSCVVADVCSYHPCAAYLIQMDM